MVGFLGKLFGRGSADPAFDTPLAPDEPICIIGDIHGCDSLFTRLLEAVDARPDSPRIVCVGDYVDRGEESRGVIDTLFERDTSDRFQCLQGNHEDILLDFIDDAADRGRRWLRYGGLQTLASYGIGGLTEQSTGEAVEAAAAEFAHALGAERIAWLRALPLWVASGNLVIVHAAADPATPIEGQSGYDLKWGHRDFPSKQRADGLWIAHGHTIVPDVKVAGGVISVDTGAYATGRLSAVVVQPDGTCEVMTATHGGVSCGYP